MNYFKKLGLAMAFAFATISFTGCFGPALVTSTATYSNPEWAPPYYTGVRYYYIPDLEMYYDLSNRNYVYMNNGMWMYTTVLPEMYANYNLASAFVIALNTSVFRPWDHHQIYVSHYPRYYYTNVYNNFQNGYARGYNENERKPYYATQERRPEGYNIKNEERGWQQQQGNRQQPQVNGNRQQPQANGNRQQPQANGNRQQPQANGNRQQPQANGNRQQPQANGNRQQPQMNKNVGQPVPVKSNMREKRDRRNNDKH